MTYRDGFNLPRTEQESCQRCFYWRCRKKYKPKKYRPYTAAIRKKIDQLATLNVNAISRNLTRDELSAWYKRLREPVSRRWLYCSDRCYIKNRNAL